MLRVLRWFWASPASAIGLAVGVVGLASGGCVQRRCGIIEFQGGSLPRLLAFLPGGVCAAITLGHVVLGRTGHCLDSCRTHEMVHVRQYERWGPFFLPAYLGYAAVIWLRGGDAYRDNPFEREAFAVAP